MPFLRRFRLRFVAVLVLIGVAAFALISFKDFVIRKNGITVRRRDGSTIAYSLPWHSSGDTRGSDVSIAESAVMDGTSIVGTIPGTVGQNAKYGGLDSNRLVSVGISDGLNAVSIVASMLNEAGAVVGIVVNDDTSTTGVLSSIAASATGFNSLSTVLSASNSRNSGPLSSGPAGILPQPDARSDFNNCSTTPAFRLNITSSTSATASLPYSPPTSENCCRSVPTTSPSYPGAEACTVTETWHSTHYDSTITFFQAVSVVTVTCTETISICPPPNPYNFLPNITNTGASTPSSPSSLNASTSTPPINTGASLRLNISLSTASSSTGVPSISATHFNWSSDASSTILCSNGSRVSKILDCLNGISGALSSSSLASPVSTDLGQKNSSTGGATNLGVASIFASVTSALANIEGLTGGLLSTVVAEMNSAMSLVSAAQAKPTVPLSATITGLLSSAVGLASSATAGNGGVQPMVPSVASVTGLVSSAVGLASSNIIANGGAQTAIPSAASVANLVSSAVGLASSTIAGIGGDQPPLPSASSVTGLISSAVGLISSAIVQNAGVQPPLPSAAPISLVSSAVGLVSSAGVENGGAIAIAGPATAAVGGAVQTGSGIIQAIAGDDGAEASNGDSGLNPFVGVSGADTSDDFSGVTASAGDGGAFAGSDLLGSTASVGDGGAFAGNDLSGSTASVGDGGSSSANGFSGLNSGLGSIRDAVDSVDDSAPTEVSPSPTIPLVTVLVNPLPVKESELKNIAAAMNALKGASRGKRRMMRRGSQMSLEDIIFCVENPDDETCTEEK